MYNEIHEWKNKEIKTKGEKKILQNSLQVLLWSLSNMVNRIRYVPRSHYSIGHTTKNTKLFLISLLLERE